MVAVDETGAWRKYGYARLHFSAVGLFRPDLHSAWTRCDLRRKLPSFVRSLPRYYDLIRLLIRVHARRVALPSRAGPAQVRARVRALPPGREERSNDRRTVGLKGVIYSHRPVAPATCQRQECLRTGRKLALPAEGDYVPGPDITPWPCERICGQS